MRRLMASLAVVAALGQPLAHGANSQHREQLGATLAHHAPVCCTPPVPVHVDGHVVIELVGDSITAGRGSTDGLGYRPSLAAALDALTPRPAWLYEGEFGAAPYRHEGIGGNTIDQLAARMPAALLHPLDAGLPVTLALVYLGTNDAGQDRTGAQMLADMSTMLDTMLAAGPRLRVVVAKITLTPRDTAGQQAQEQAYDDGLPALAASKGARVVVADGTGIEIGPDEVHPDDAGYRALAARLFAALVLAGWV